MLVNLSLTHNTLRAIPPRGAIPRAALRCNPVKPNSFRPQVFAADREAARERQAWREALAAKRAQLMALLDDLGAESDRYLQKEAELLAEDLQRLEM